MSILLIDGDLYCYKIVTRNQIEILWPSQDGVMDNTYTITINLDECISQWSSFIQMLKNKFNTNSVIVAFSGSSNRNFRKTDVYPLYKSNRLNKFGLSLSKPIGYNALTQYIEKNYKVVREEILEGDDVLGLLAYSNHHLDPIIVSFDKDMLTIPHVTIYNTESECITQLDELEANRVLFKQILTGDKSDGYPGLVGIGPVKADRLLDDVSTIEDMEKIVKDTFDKAKDFTGYDLNRRCAYILYKNTDYDWNSKRVLII